LAETLTESFCERCGTRYEFKAPTRLNPLRKTRGLIGGLKNYVMSQDALGDAVGDAMRSEEERLASAQLEAFHESFNFCIDCRQYTCLNCWNDDAGRCRSCAPIPGTDDLAERLAASVAGNGAVAEPLADGAEAFGAGTIGPESWPTSDLPEIAAGNGHVHEAWPAADDFVYEAQPESSPTRADDGFVYTTEPEASPPRANDGFVYDDAPPDEVAAAFQSATVASEPEPEPFVAQEPEAEPFVAQEPEAEPLVAQEPEPEPISAWAAAELELEPEHVAAEEAPAVTAEEAEPLVAETVEAERRHLRVVAWDEDASYDLEPVAAQEPEVVAVEPAEPVVAEEPEPVATEQPPAPEPVAPHRIAPISETILRFPDRQAPPPAAPPLAAEDETPEVAARRAQLDLLGLGDPGEGPVQPTRPSVVPYRSRGATPTAGELAARAAAATGTTFWEASAREVASAAAMVGVQNCGQCGLSLSANARFCRRCGTRQAQSA
jgi:hypothetical protein